MKERKEVYCAILRVFTVDANPTAKCHSQFKTTIFLYTYREQILSGLVPQGDWKKRTKVYVGGGGLMGSDVRK